MHRPTPSTLVSIISLILVSSAGTSSAWAGSFVTLSPLRDSDGCPLMVNHRAEQQPERSELIECAVPVFDFGRIKGGDRVICSFPIKNVSDGIVRVSFLPCCSGTCNFRDPIILPGQTIYIHRKLSTSKGSGGVSLNIRVTATSISTPDWVGFLIRSGIQQCTKLSQVMQDSASVFRIIVAARIAIC